MLIRFSAGHWPGILELFADGESFFQTFEEWRAVYLHALSRLRHDGYQVFVVDFDFEEFCKWCKKRCIEPDAMARAEYAAVKAKPI